MNSTAHAACATPNSGRANDVCVAHVLRFAATKDMEAPWSMSHNLCRSTQPCDAFKRGLDSVVSAHCHVASPELLASLQRRLNLAS